MCERPYNSAESPGNSACVVERFGWPTQKLRRLAPQVHGVRSSGEVMIHAASDQALPAPKGASSIERIQD